MGTSRLLWPIAAPAPPQPPVLSLALSALTPEDDSGGRWTGGFAYAPHNHGAAWLRDPCDKTPTDAAAIAAPTGTTAAPSATGGSLTAGLYSYKVTYLNADGETAGSATVTATAPDGTTGSVDIAVPMPVNAVERGITVRIYGRIAGSLGRIASGLTTGLFTDTGAVDPGAVPPISNTTGGPGVYSNLAIVHHYPTIAVVEDTCSSFGWKARDFKGRVTTLLDNATPKALGHEFFTGAQSTREGYDNNFLTKSGVTDLTPVSVPSVLKGIQILEDALANMGFGGRGMIHVTPDTTPDLLNSRRVGATLLSMRDNVIVADAGYTGYGPSNAAPALGFAYIYATDLVSVRIDPMVTIFPDSFEEALDRGNAGQPNTITFRAERFVAATWDGAAHFCTKVALAA